MSIRATGIPTPSPAARAVEEEGELLGGSVEVEVEVGTADCETKVAASIVEAEVC